MLKKGENLFKSYRAKEPQKSTTTTGKHYIVSPTVQTKSEQLCVS